MIRPTAQELAHFGEPDFVIYNAGPFPANRYTSFMTSSTSVDLSLGDREMVILGERPAMLVVVVLGRAERVKRVTCGCQTLRCPATNNWLRGGAARVRAGTQYAGEMKKGIFTVMHYLMPKRGILSLHSGCNIGTHNDVTLFFGLSGASTSSPPPPPTHAPTCAACRAARPPPTTHPRPTRWCAAAPARRARRHRQDDAVDRPAAPAHRRRRALLGRHWRFQR